MTKAGVISRLNYLLGRIEGISAGIPVDQQSYLLDTAEWLAAVIDELEIMEFTEPFSET